MPPVTSENVLAKFQSEFEKIGGTNHHATSPHQLDTLLQAILDASEANSVVLSGNPLLSELNLIERLRTWGKTVTAWSLTESSTLENPPANPQAFKSAGFDATVGMTGVDFVLAETGSLVLTSLTERTQLASLAPPTHIALYRPSQVINSLDEVLAKLRPAQNADLPLPGRSIVFVTGNSRTADIEQVLIRGVHGPREVHAILVEDSCLE